LISTFERDAAGRRPVFGDSAKFQNDPHWRDLLLFYEYFNGDTGAGHGASHQTGWTGCIARMIQINGVVTDETTSPGNIESRVAKALAPEHTNPGLDVESRVR
jgi:hypothetical protein